MLNTKIIQIGPHFVALHGKRSSLLLGPSGGNLENDDRLKFK